jgi:putative ABC transport system permease protein
MASLGLRNLLHDKVRLTVTITGIVFAVVLIVVQFGLFVGFTSTTANNINHAGADLWITYPGVRNFDQGHPLADRKRYQALAVPGVSQAEKYIMGFTQWKRPDGSQESVEIIGFELNSGMGGPWNVIQGSVADLELPDSVIIDEAYRNKLGVDRIGDTVEVNDHRARVVGFTRDIRSFTTSPFVYTSYRNAQRYMDRVINADQTMYVLVKASPGANLPELKQALRATLDNVDVHERTEFARMTQFYWMFTTGAGTGLLIAAVMGLVVGVVVVAQTIYATTMDHLKEYGTLKAMGAANRQVYRVIIEQAAISAVIGYVLGMLISIVVVRYTSGGGAVITLDASMAAGMFVVTVLMCVSAALISISKVTRLDPAMVFKG